MKKKLTLTLLFLSTLIYCQKQIDPTPEDITQAKSLKVVYPDDDVVLINSNDYIEFDINKDNQQVIVNHKVDQNLMNISSRADIQTYDMYNSESNVEYFIIKYRNDKEAPFSPKYESYTSNDLFHNDTKVVYTNLDFPVQGYQYALSSKKKYEDIKYFTSIYFPDDYPTLKRTITFVVPDWLELELKEMNFDGFDIEKTEVYDEKNKTRTISFTVSNLDAHYDDKMAPGPSFIYPHILVLAKSFTYKKERHTLFKNTKDLYAWYKSLVDDMTDEPFQFQGKVSELTSNTSSDEEKIKNIYYWVQDNIRYIAFEDGIAGFKPDDSQNVYNKRYGDCKGMANLIKQMLILAGFDARLTWIGTNHIAYDYSTPSLSVDNHMICTVIKDGKKIFLDGTEKYNPFGEYAERIQGKQALIENGDDYILEQIPVANSADNQSHFIYNAKIENDEIVGDAHITYKGESKASFLYNYNNLMTNKKGEALNYYLNNGDHNIIVADINPSDFNDRENDLNLDYHLILKNTISSFDGTIYLDLDKDREFATYNLEDRKTDLVFNFKKHLESEINLEIPEGYTIEHLPEAIDEENEDFKIHLSYNLNNNILEYKKLFIIKNAKIKKATFEHWNKTIERLKSTYNEQLILTLSK